VNKRTKRNETNERMNQSFSWSVDQPTETARKRCRICVRKKKN